MTESRPDIPDEELVGADQQDVHQGETRGDKPSARRLKTNGVFDEIDEIDDELGDALHQVLEDFSSDTSKVDDGWITFEDISASVPPKLSEPPAYNGVKTPLRPPAPKLIIDSQRGDSEKPPAILAAPRLPMAPFFPRDVARSRELVSAKRLREQKLAAEAVRLELLLADYVVEIQKTLAPLRSEIRRKEASPMEVDFLELKRIAHGNNGVVDRIDFQVFFRRLSETYDIERFDTYLINLLRLAQPLNIPHLGDDSEKWQVSAKARIETAGQNSPPKVLLFKVDFTSEGKKNRHQLVELVYILQALPLFT